ncbi:UDP-3-O-acyl-N-acetylglucosamine deacetylase [Acidobacteria bacterium AH-259-O06]|nr:UDP-3-O-acyl-N-acetylglucosamine deacetylase [Acidobacteria bacterium AH-259-O06]
MQRTIKKPVRVSGIGLHTGCQVSLELRPASEDTGIVFRRVDLQNFEIEAVRKRVSRVVLATTLMKKGVMLSTVEHLLSAFYGLGLDNLYIDIDSLEVPILDGSALLFVEMVKKAGVQKQNEERTFLKVKEPIRLEEGEKFISIEPSSTFQISYEIDFTHPAIGHQVLNLEITPEIYTAEIAFARTFGFYSEVEQMLEKGLIRGGSFDNAVVLSETGIMNGGLRSPDEFVRHKVLDLIGDISLCGYPLIGHIKAYKAGHALHTDLATALVRNSKLCRKVRESELISQAVNF